MCSSAVTDRRKKNLFTERVIPRNTGAFGRSNPYIYEIEKGPGSDRMAENRPSIS